MSLTMSKFKIGDKVERPLEEFVRKGRIRTIGRIGRAYVYGVQWDDSLLIDRGYLEHGLFPSVDAPKAEVPVDPMRAGHNAQRDRT